MEADAIMEALVGIQDTLTVMANFQVLNIVATAIVAGCIVGALLWRWLK